VKLCGFFVLVVAVVLPCPNERAKVVAISAR